MTKNPRLIDIAGQRFGRWVVARKAGNTVNGAAVWACACDCGVQRNVLGADLRKGKSTSCGHGNKDRIGALRRTHHASGTRLHRIWKNIRKRCLNPNDPGYANYGGRGISISPSWEVFEEFRTWAQNAGYRDDLSIERLDVSGNYEPGNCIWATSQMQNENRRFVAKAPSGQLWLHIARANGVTDAAYRSRLYEGWDYHSAATWPLGKRRTERRRDAKGHFF